MRLLSEWGIVSGEWQQSVMLPFTYYCTLLTYKTDEKNLLPYLICADIIGNS